MGPGPIPEGALMRLLVGRISQTADREAWVNLGEGQARVPPGSSDSRKVTRTLWPFTSRNTFERSALSEL
jgi:hypothetical protein